MRVSKGRSHRTEGGAAIEEATAGWDDDPEIVFVFCSTAQDAQEVTAALAARFPSAPLAGCTTSGEHLCGEHTNASVVVSAVYESGMRWAVESIDDAAGFDLTAAESIADTLFQAVGVDRNELIPSELVCLLMVDGLSMAEERVSAHLAEALEGVPLAGGSAGDDLKFERTFSITREGARQNAATVVLAHQGTASIAVLKHQHFLETPTSLCITEANTETRTVFEMDGYPAVEAYAAALGMKADALTDAITFQNPLTFACNGELYVRSIQSRNEDGSLTFYCGIEEGMVLHVSAHEGMKESLERDLVTWREQAARADLVIEFNCILRALEAAKRSSHEALGEALMQASKNIIGFDTYGEQLDGLHINQTLVAVAFRGA